MKAQTPRLLFISTLLVAGCDQESNNSSPRQPSAYRALPASGAKSDSPVQQELKSLLLNSGLSRKDKEAEVTRLLDDASQRGIHTLVQTIKQLPTDGSFDKIAGRKLAQCARLFPAQAVTMVHYCFQEFAPDKASQYASFLLSACRSPDALSQLAAIPIPLEKRADYIARVLDNLRETHSSAQRIDLIAAMPEGDLKQKVMSSHSFIVAQFETDYRTAVLYMEEHPVEKLSAIANQLHQLPNRSDLFSAISSSQIPNKERLLNLALGSWMTSDLNASLSWLNTVSAGSLKDSLIANSWRQIAKEDQEAASYWIGQIADDERRAKLEADLNSFPK